MLTGRKPLHPLFTQEAWTALTSIKTVNKRAYNNGNPLYQTLLDEWHCTRSQSETESTEVSHIFKDKTFKEYAYIFLYAHKTPRKPLPKYSPLLMAISDLHQYTLALWSWMPVTTFSNGLNLHNFESKICRMLRHIRNCSREDMRY